LFLLAACGGGGGPADDDVADDDAPAPDATPAGWETLISSDWSIAPGEEYRCERLTLDQDVWIKNFRSTIPLGHHHAVLTVESDPSQSDGQTVCNAGTNAPMMIYGSAPGTDDVLFPEGVAIKVPAGSQLVLNLHLYNTQPSAELTGTSTILYQPVPAEEIATTTEAEVVLMGKVDFMIAPGPDEVTGHCTMSGATTLFMTQPHMHKLGTHARVVAKRAAGDVVLHDGPYNFLEQKVYPIAPEVQMAGNDALEVTCSYDNTTGADVPFGDSTDEEMCFATTYRYPKLASNTAPYCVF